MESSPDDRAAESRERLESWRRYLRRFEGAKDRGPIDFMPELMGSSAVATMGEIESFMRDLVESISLAINREHVAVKELRPELRVIHAQSTFDSIQNAKLGNQEFWARRAEVAKLHLSNDIAKLPTRRSSSPQAPLRGNTITSRDVREIAVAFGFRHPTELVSNPHIATALHKLAGYRNDYAHRKIPPSEIFSNPARDLRCVISYIGDICNLLDLLADAWHDVISCKLFLDRPPLGSVHTLAQDDRRN